MSNNTDEDPWGCFGDDESDEGNGDQNNSEEDQIQLERRRELITKANTKTASNFNATLEVDNDDKKDLTQIGNRKDIKLPPTIELWSHRQPLYIGPMAVIEETNGLYRGYIATEDMEPGTLLLVEEPIFKWPEEQIGSELGLSSIQAIIGDEEFAQDIVHDMEVLYPTRVDVDAICRCNHDNQNHSKEQFKNSTKDNVIESNEKLQIKDMIEIMQMQHSGGKELQMILKLAQEKNLTKASTQLDDGTTVRSGLGTIIDEIDIMRMLLALRYNGFDSGLYLHFALFNHNDNANCIKYLPEKTNTNHKRILKGEKKTRAIYSEVRTTKFVKKGEPLTLHYLNPREVSHATRRLHIWNQHRFDIGSDMKMHHDSRLGELELVNGKFPESSKDKQDSERITSFIENAIDDLEKLHREIDLASRFLLGKEIEDGAIEMFERCKALEIATDELIRAASQKTGNEKHILLIRCCRLHLDSSELLLRYANHPPLLTLSNKQQTEIMCRFVRTCHVLLPIQTQYLGEHHPDIARTNYDFAMGVNSLLSHSPKKLFSLGLSNLSTFNSCQRYEAKCRKEHHRIDLLYPRDAEEKIVLRSKNKI